MPKYVYYYSDGVGLFYYKQFNIDTFIDKAVGLLSHSWCYFIIGNLCVRNNICR